MNVTSDEVILALQNTRLYIDRDGWGRNAVILPDGGYCLFGAVRQATHGWDNNPIFLRTMEQMASVLPTGLGATAFERVRIWNDEEAKDKQEVLDKIDEALVATATDLACDRSVP